MPWPIWRSAVPVPKPGRGFFRVARVHEGTPYFREPIDSGHELCAGNVFLADRPELELTLVCSARSRKAGLR